MSTIQVDARVKKDLFAVAAELQRTLGRKVSLNEAIGRLIASYRKGGHNTDRLLSLFGILGHGNVARRTLAELRKDEERRLERATRKRGA